MLTGLSGFWFARTQRHRPEPPARAARRRPLDRVPPAGDAADRVRRARLHRRLGLEGLPRDGRGLRPPAARRASRVGAAAGADLHAGDEGADRPRREHRPRRRRRARRRGALRRGRADRARALPLRVGATRATRGIILADTKLEFGIDERRSARARRRGVHARLVALLAGRRVRSPAERSRRSTSSSSATTASRSAGTRPTRARSCRTTSSPARARATSRRSSG